MKIESSLEQSGRVYTYSGTLCASLRSIQKRYDSDYAQLREPGTLPIFSFPTLNAFAPLQTGRMIVTRCSKRLSAVPGTVGLKHEPQLGGFGARVTEGFSGAQS